MSSPYLKSGESIILTTDRVSINSLLYEVLLTTRHLILVDIRYDQFLPQQIPLSTILSVKGGKLATGEPVITLIFSDNDSMPGSGPMVLIFTQQPGEQRKRERDEWLKNLMANIVSVRQETITSGPSPVDAGHGIRPSSRRPGAHEKITPYTTIIDTSPAPVELVILPDESESLVIAEDDQESPGNALLETDTTPEINYTIPECEEIPPDEGMESRSAGTPPPIELEEIVDSRPAIADEEKLPDTVITEASAAGDSSAEPETNSVAEKPFALILYEAVKSLLSSEEKKELPGAGPSSETGNAILETDTTPEINYTIPECEEILPDEGMESRSAVTLPPIELKEIVDSRPAIADEEKLPDTAITEAPSAGDSSAEPETNSVAEKPFALILHEAVKSLLSSEEKKELPDAGPSSEPPGEDKEAPQQEEPESPEPPTLPEPDVVETPIIVKEDSELSGMIPSKAVDIAEPGQEPSGQAMPQIPKSPPPTRGSGSQRQTLILVTTIILIIFGIGIGVVFYSHGYPSQGKEPVPLPTPSLQQTTLLQTPVQQTTPQQITLPQTTVQITEAPIPVEIPMDGIWVRVVYNGNYNGRVGNPGSLQSVKGSGDQIYKIKSDGLVQLQINKNDNTGNPLTVEIYRNGELMMHQVRSAPMGSIELLIDAKTGNPPRITSVLTNETNQTGSSGERVMYF
jgi:hypothetical protein